MSSEMTHARVFRSCPIPSLCPQPTEPSTIQLNFGLTELRVVNPKCDILSEPARAIAAGSVKILENAKTFATLEECLADLQRIFAATVRPRHMTQMVYTPSAAAEQIIQRNNNDVKVGIMFGTENAGLTNDEVALADTIITIPSFKHFSSLNLAQAVNIVGFELFKRNLEVVGAAPPDHWLNPKSEGERLAKREEMDFMMNRLETYLDEKEYQKNPSIRESNFRNIRNIFQRTLVTKQEVDLLHGVLSALVKDRRNGEGQQRLIDAIEREDETTDAKLSTGAHNLPMNGP